MFVQTVAEAIGDWYFDREITKEVDCPYPCNPTCPMPELTPAILAANTVSKLVLDLNVILVAKETKLIYNGSIFPC